jgi:hypothetical protein
MLKNLLLVTLCDTFYCKNFVVIAASVGKREQEANNFCSWLSKISAPYNLLFSFAKRKGSLSNWLATLQWLARVAKQENSLLLLLRVYLFGK